MKKHLSLLLALLVCLSFLVVARPVQAEGHDTLTVATAYDAITLDPVANNDSPSSHAMHQI